jgi:hypothetical protein
MSPQDYNNTLSLTHVRVPPLPVVAIRRSVQLIAGGSCAATESSLKTDKNRQHQQKWRWSWGATGEGCVNR